MKPTALPPLSDDDLHALTDMQGSLEGLADLQDRLKDDPQANQRMAQWQRQRQALKRLHADVLHEAIPPALVQAATQIGNARASGHTWWRYTGLAAGVLLTFAAGWLASLQWQSSRFQDPASTVARTPTARDFVRQASLAHSIYVPETRHPVEVNAIEQAHLVQWLSKRLGKPLKVPDLNPQGFELVGGRLLPGEGGARAQFMFQNPTGNRVTLYLGVVNPADKRLSTAETSFHYEATEGVGSFYWVDKGFGYALAGQLPREALMKLADLVYQQL